jgi:hypothetical protein
LGKTDEADKYQALIWVAPYAHILIAKYGQAYSADGTHCMSVHGWRAIPLCVLNSLGSPVSVGIAWAPTENAGVMTLLCKQVAIQCQSYGVPCPFEHEHPKSFRDTRDLYMSPDWVDPLSKDIICYPPLRDFVKSVFEHAPDTELIPEVDNRPTFMSDGGLAFRNMADVFNLHHVLCKKHLYALDHLGSTADKYVLFFASSLFNLTQFGFREAAQMARSLIWDKMSTSKWALYNSVYTDSFV